MGRRAGRSLIALPGPTNVPDAVLEAIGRPTIDHRGDEFAGIVRGVLRDLRPVFGTSGPIAMYPGSGTGGWEAALVNTLSPGDRVLSCETGFFAAGWAALAGKLGLAVDVIATDWRGPADPAAIAAALEHDEGREIRAVLVVHNETSTGATSDVGAIRAAIDRVGHPALLLVDAVSSLGAMPVRHDEWRADVTVTASQKGLMLPPGLAMLAVSGRARAARESAGLPRAYWDWEPMLAAGETGSLPYTPATNLVVGLRVALDLLAGDGLEAVFARHRRLAGAVRRAASQWGLEFVCGDPAARSESVTAILLPDGVDDGAVRAGLLDRFGVTLGGGLGRLGGRCLRIGHLGDIDELMIVSVLAAIEIGLADPLGLPAGGVQAAIAALAGREPLA
ncbi:MAG TPA: aminotransferase class V-fold PLP-dependent enzyme [Solirubrobacteraceae bacterium]|jgi:alanine-glyoxylate transaminase/serine-glyoxylate transaminase/serine-pyruvate transaminase|nr:aminotransferase class V-fold PLP-dependent enzyme [Solirubrobacteraceae bacterium]